MELMWHVSGSIEDLTTNPDDDFYNPGGFGVLIATNMNIPFVTKVDFLCVQFLVFLSYYLCHGPSSLVGDT